MSTRQTLPVLPLRGTVIFPGLTAPIAAGRPGTLRAIEAALKGDRLVFANGILSLSFATAVLILLFHGDTHALIPLFAVGVFMAFTLSQTGMVVHWWKERSAEPRWKHGLFVNGLGCTLTASILCITMVMKFPEGGWVTLVVTGALVAFCFYTRRHYRKAEAGVKSLDDLIHALPAGREPSGREPVLRREAPTAVILVSGFNGLGMHVFFSVVKQFPGMFRNFIFISASRIGIIRGPRDLNGRTTESSWHVVSEMADHSSLPPAAPQHAGGWLRNDFEAIVAQRRRGRTGFCPGRAGRRGKRP